MCKMSQQAKYGKKPRQMVKNKEELKKKNLNFSFIVIVTTLPPPYHTQNVEGSWGGSWECTNMREIT